ncbi:MAG: dihydrodipicolinate reductase [Sulfurovum sp. PC08-66]|nr:MAG: dihydrodipicolinate reductase [Sulfurovum sp. PC08-66]KIM12554.1 MAG: dihydrodipicolinate reductase [Sulfuricurvum sp. PC08-66]
MTTLKVGVFGATGRVGQLILNTLRQDKEAGVSVVYVRNSLDFSVDPSILVTNDMRTFLKSCDVVIDFSLPDATEKLLETAMKDLPKPLVIGTTGLSQHQLNLMQQASQTMPILYATNMSLGVALLNQLVALASKSLDGFDIEIVEMHHKFKKDAPSGTALTLAEHAAKARGLNLDDVRVSGRDGAVGERTPNEISVMALRGGDVVGRHTVGFYNEGEYLELTHTATNRATFAKGSIRAAKWLVLASNGLHTINECLGLDL